MNGKAQELSPVLKSTLFCQGTSRGAVRPGDLREGEVGGEDGALLQIPHQLRCVMRIEHRAYNHR